MYVYMERDEHRWLVKTVERRLRDLHGDIDGSQTKGHIDELREEQNALQRLLDRLHEAECDVFA